MSLLIAVMGTTACSEDSLSDNSYIKDSQTTPTPLDNWLVANYITPYNIEFKYRYQDMESDMDYNLVPAYYDKAIQMAKLVKHLCLEAYDEVTGSNEFIRSYFPKILYMVGSPAYNNNGTIILGTAEGGTKITLYNLNVLDPTDADLLNDRYFKTIHHEFAHILNQTKPYTNDFAQITGTTVGIEYVGNSCWDVYPTTVAALADGFISRYSATSDGEDFVELASIFVTNTATDWETLLSAAGTVGRPMIEAKFDIVFSYMKNEWGIDLNEMRDTVLRRQSEISTLDLDNI